jgi:hypothetical protein
MKANELRIGNLIDTGDFHIPSCKGIYEMKNDWFTYSNMFNPIPLTEEWLLKFGFKQDETYCSIHIKYGIELMNIANKYFRGYYRGATIAIDIQYVHQLQNLYFALTGEELTVK